MYRTHQVDEALVDAHLVAVPGLGALTAGRLAGGDTQDLGGQAHRPLHIQVLVLGPTLQVSTHCVQQRVGPPNLAIKTVSF